MTVRSWPTAYVWPVCGALQLTIRSLSVGASASSKLSRRHSSRLGRGGAGAAVGGAAVVGPADGVEPEAGSSSPEQPVSAERGDEQEGDEPAHAEVFAQQTERRLPAFHSASWNQV